MTSTNADRHAGGPPCEGGSPYPPGQKCQGSGCGRPAFRGLLCRPCFLESPFACGVSGCAGWVRGEHGLCDLHGCSMCGGRLPAGQELGSCPPCLEEHHSRLRLMMLARLASLLSSEPGL